LSHRVAAGDAAHRVRAVASIFVSRIDAAIDARLPADAADLRGQIAIASARSCYALWQQRFGAAFDALRAAGAEPPMCLWASTGSKDPTARDTRYVEALIGPDTVNTVPEPTLIAFADHGNAERRLDLDPTAAQAVLARAASIGIDLEALGDELQIAGLKQFDDAFDRLLATVA
jgi:transaldolase